MAETFSGAVEITDANGNATFQLFGDTGLARIGRASGGHLVVTNSAGREWIFLDGGGLGLFIGAGGQGGQVNIQDASGTRVFHVNGDVADVTIGGRGNKGDLFVLDARGKPALHLDGGFGVLRLGVAGNGGDIIVNDDAGREVLRFQSHFALLDVGGKGNEGDIRLRNDAGAVSIHLDGGAGKISMPNADLAEQFDLAEAVAAEPGTVMALAERGLLAPTAAAYDARVVGVVAGGGRYRSGIVMDERADAAGRRVEIAMVGKAACRVDAGHGPVAVGDLLASSPTPGCAMRAADPGRAFGAVIGKALTPLDDGVGLVDMIIALQ